MINLGKDNFKSELKPERDWRLALISFFFLLAGAAFFHYYLFLGFSQREPVPETKDAGKPIGLDTESLQKVIANFEAKEKKMRQYLENELPVSDPAR